MELKIGSNGRFLAKDDGAPFFWLADTAWELFHRLTKEETKEYLATRASQQFTVIQAVALAEFYGLTEPNAYGRVPLQKNKEGNFDPCLPDLDQTHGAYTYWHHVDFVVDTAGSLGLFVGLLPTWGDKFNLKWGKETEIFTPENAAVYGEWIGGRYKDRENIIWIMGGDRPLENDTHRAVVKNMAEAIKRSTHGRHLMTYHPMGGMSSSEQLHGEPWLDFNMIQSSHGAGIISNYEFVQRDYAKEPIKPTLDGEPRYEDHPAGFKPENGYFDDFDVRVAAYYSMLSGALGHTYGNHSIWSFNREKQPYFPLLWRDALRRPGAEHMKHLKELFMARPFLELAPCQELLAENYPGANYIAAAKGKNYAYLYTPNGLDIKVNTAMLDENRIASYWYDPRNGRYYVGGMQKNDGTGIFSPPSSGKNNDWVLVLEWGM